MQPRLAAIGLSADQVKNQSLDELNQSLDRLNDAINKPESFGFLRMNFDAGVGLVIARTSAQVEIGILPLLLERKKLVVDRIADLRKAIKIDSLRGLIGAVPDEALKTRLQHEVSDLEESSRKLKQQSTEIERAQQELKASSDIEITRLRLEVFERRSKVWRSFLERESVATLVGGILLLVIGAAILVSMFLRLTISDIVSNTFLLILGYFFGQSTSKSSAKTE